MILAIQRVKNEERWIQQSIASALTVAGRVILFDDNSTDATVELAQKFPLVEVIKSPFQGLDEARDKNFLMMQASRYQPEWILMLDGDEVICPGSALLVEQIAKSDAEIVRFRILYLWDKANMVRVDRAFDMKRASMFRFKPGLLTYENMGVGNLHCGMLPQQIKSGKYSELLIPVLHYGSFDAETRARKLLWYRSLDPNDKWEDGEHMVQGDRGMVDGHPCPPAKKFCKHAGPMEIVPIEQALNPKVRQSGPDNNARRQFRPPLTKRHL